MIKTQIKEDLVQVIILDISGIYAQIHNQGYYDNNGVNEIKQQYSDKQHWQVVVLN